MIYRPDSGKRLSHQNLAKFALCRKILRRQDNYPPRWFKRRVGQKSPLVSEDWQADFQWKIDALLMLWPSEKGRKPFERLIITNFRTVERRFSCKQKPVNALLSGIYGLFVDGRDRTARTLDTRFWRQCWIFSHAQSSPRFWGFVAHCPPDDGRIDAFLMMWLIIRLASMLNFCIALIKEKIFLFLCWLFLNYKLCL